MLTGGHSTRMGRDKALLQVDGVAMAVRVAAAMSAAGAADVRCVGGDLTALRVLGLTAVPDAHENEGPLAGVLAGLDSSAELLVVIAPCDLVEPTAELFTDLVTALKASDAAAVVPIVEGRWRPLPIALRREVARAPLAQAFAAGERAVHRAVEGLEFVAVDVGPIADADAPGDLPGHR